MITLQYMEEFVVLAETLNFSKTAEKLFTSQPAISRHISMIEEEIGVKLFVRDTRNVQITASGKEVYGAFKNTLASYEQARERAIQLALGKTGTLKISSPYYSTEDFVEPVLKLFAQKHPRYHVQISSCQPAEGLLDVMEKRSDLTLLAITGYEEPDSLCRVQFAEERLGVMVGLTHPLADKDSAKITDLKDDTLIFIEGVDSLNNLAFSLFEKRQMAIKDVIFTQQVDTIGLAIMEMGGVSIMPYDVRNMNRSYIKMIPLAEDDCLLPKCLIYRKDNENPAVLQYVRTSKEVFRGK